MLFDDDLRDAARQVLRHAVEARLALDQSFRAPLTRAAAEVLLSLWVDGPGAAPELATRLAVERSMIARAFSDLEHEQLVAISSAEADRRSRGRPERPRELTPAGEKAVRDLAQRIRQRN